MEYLNSGISEEETLQVALQSGIIDINEISMRIEDMKRKEILSNHPYSIWYSETDNLWKTYLPDIENKNGRIFRKRKNKKDLEDLIVKYYISHQQEIYLKDVFTEWSESKLKYGEIQKQSYDRYCTDFQRFFSSAHPICRKKFKNITYPDLTDFIKSSIHEKHLTRKSYAGLRLLVRGIFKYGKSKGEVKTIQMHGNKTTTDYYIQVLDYLWKHQEDYKDILKYLGESFPEYYYKTYNQGLTIYQKPGYVREALNVDAIVMEDTPYLIAIYTRYLGGSDEETSEINNVGLQQLEMLCYVINEWHRVNMN